MPMQPATLRWDRLVLVLGALVGASLGCASAPKEGAWFDACCDSCTADHCEGCSEKKRECGGEVGAEEGQCLVDNGMMMCRPEQAERH
jgi:hypothetical protein